MRTDLVTAYLIYQWLQKHAPSIAAEWLLEVDDQIKKIAQGTAALMPDAAIQVTGQHLLARATIRQWKLSHVALLAGGRPTPLSPSPAEVLYYTDANPEVVAEATAAGYTTRQVDVTKPDSLKQLNGATTVIATGLFHFLPDAAAHAVFNGFAGAGFSTIVFNHGYDGAGEAGAKVRELYKKMGVTLYPRYVHEVQALIPDYWQVEQAVHQAEFLQDDPLMGAHIADMPDVIDVYRVVKL